MELAAAFGCKGLSGLSGLPCGGWAALAAKIGVLLTVAATVALMIAGRGAGFGVAASSPLAVCGGFRGGGGLGVEGFGLFVVIVRERGCVGGDRFGEPVGLAFAREHGFGGAVAEGGGEGIVALDGVEEDAGVGVGGVETAKDIVPVGFAGGFDGFRETLMANAPLLVSGAGDAEEGAGVVDRFALGEEVEEVLLPVLALAEFGFVGAGLEFEGFSVGGLHSASFRVAGADVAMPGRAL